MISQFDTTNLYTISIPVKEEGGGRREEGGGRKEEGGGRREEQKRETHLLP